MKTTPFVCSAMLRCRSADLQSAVSWNCIPRTFQSSERRVPSNAQPIGNRRHGRSKICVTSLLAISLSVSSAFAGKILYTYDDAERLITATYGAGSGRVTTHTYDLNGNLTGQNTSVPPGVVGRRVFYNQSAWDGNDANPNANDDQAIATDKAALLPNGTATFANYTSFTKGLNGVMVDLQNPTLPAAITTLDFGFKTGNDDSPAGWPAAQNPLPLTLANIRQLGGPSGPYRVSLTWNANNLDAITDLNEAVAKQWLQVTVHANPVTVWPTPMSSTSAMPLAKATSATPATAFP